MPLTYIYIFLLIASPPRFMIVRAIKCYDTNLATMKPMEVDCKTGMDSCIKYDLSLGSRYSEKQSCGSSSKGKDACVVAKNALDARKLNLHDAPDILPDHPLTGMPRNPNAPPSPQDLEQKKKDDEKSLELLFAFSLAEAYGQPLSPKDKKALMDAYSKGTRSSPGELVQALDGGKVENFGELMKNCHSCKSDLCNVSNCSRTTASIAVIFSLISAAIIK